MTVLPADSFAWWRTLAVRSIEGAAHASCVLGLENYHDVVDVALLMTGLGDMLMKKMSHLTECPKKQLQFALNLGLGGTWRHSS